MKKILEIGEMQKQFRQLVKTRNWESANTPKNVSMALAVEAAELMEIFQWLTEKQSFEIKNDPEKLQQVQDEIADVFFHILGLTDMLGIDLSAAFWSKLKKTEEKYPQTHQSNAEMPK